MHKYMNVKKHNGITQIYIIKVNLLSIKTEINVKLYYLKINLCIKIMF